MNETQLKKKVLIWLKKEYSEGFFIKISDRFQTGIPDILGCVKGRFIAIELKIPGGKLTKLQSFVLNKLSLTGALTGVCYSLGEVKELLIMNLYE